MVFSKNHEDLVFEFYLCTRNYRDNEYQRLFQLIPLLERVNDDIVEAVIQVIEKRNHFLEQKHCGLILSKAAPKTQKTLDEILSRTLPTWNKSVRELPFWVQAQFGQNSVIEEFNRLEQESASEIVKDNLLTMKWRLKIKTR